jgi:uncharacterized protein YegJ (DUF2314 family)
MPITIRKKPSATASNSQTPVSRLALSQESIAMSESEPSKVFMFDNSDPEMHGAYEKARATFRYFWREIAWERRRIVPGLDLACVKAPFSDGGRETREDGNPNVEHMWIGEVDFNGRSVSGTLLNAPNWLSTVKEGDAARIPLGEISDWMYAINGEVYGAYTVNLMRSRMGRRERKEHDDAWGLNFGDPDTIRVVPDQKRSGGIFKALFGGRQDTEIQEHPMSEAMGPSLKAALLNDPSMVHVKDDEGWTFLHQQALAGSTASVEILLEAGADPHAKTNDGMTPLELAQSLRWDRIVALLAGR